MAEQATQSRSTTNLIRSTHQKVRERWVIRGMLVLDTPAHFGASEIDDILDMPILLDESDDTPLLPGASIAGALRNFLREIERGDGSPLPTRPSREEAPDPRQAEEIFAKRQNAERHLAATMLFGGYRGDDEGEQSPLIVYDAPGKASGYEVRDGVAIESKTRTAADDKKYDIQLLSAGSSFELCFELVGRSSRSPQDMTEWDETQAYLEHRSQLLNALATALDGLARGEITLGARKRRGFGRCSVKEWCVQHYDMANRDQFLAWLASGHDEGDSWHTPVEAVRKADIAEAVSLPVERLADHRKRVVLTATFALDSSLLIRSGFGETDSGADIVHLQSQRGKASVPIVAGTSWAGVLRHRAEQIANTLASSDERVQKFLDGIFGPAKITSDDKFARASRLTTNETVVTGGHSLVQTRVKIDRFTGGAFEEALFSEQPLIGDADACIGLTVTLRPKPPADPLQEPSEPEPAEIGLLLLLLKDLWTGDLPVGGESSVGRGRLRGYEATLSIGGGQTWTFQAGGPGKLIVQDRQQLEQYVSALTATLTGG